MLLPLLPFPIQSSGFSSGPPVHHPLFVSHFHQQVHMIPLTYIETLVNMGTRSPPPDRPAAYSRSYHQTSSSSSRRSISLSVSPPYTTCRSRMLWYLKHATNVEGRTTRGAFPEAARNARLRLSTEHRNWTSHLFRAAHR